MKITKTKWWKLKEDASQVFKYRLITEGAWNVNEDVNSMWKEIATRIREVIVEVFEVTRGNKHKPLNGT